MNRINSESVERLLKEEGIDIEYKVVEEVCSNLCGKRKCQTSLCEIAVRKIRLIKSGEIDAVKYSKKVMSMEEFVKLTNNMDLDMEFSPNDIFDTDHGHWGCFLDRYITIEGD